MMNGMERLGALMSGRLPDRVPIVCNLLDQGARELDISLRDYYADGELVAYGQLKLRERYGYDTLLGMFYSALEAEIMGCRSIVYSDDGPPNVGHLVIRDPGDIDTLKVPEPFDSHPRAAQLLRCVSMLKRESAGRFPVLGVVTASFSLPAMLMGIGPWMELFLTGPPPLRDRLLETCSRFVAEEIAALRSAGADLIVYVNPVASASIILPSLFRDLALQWIIRDLESGGYGGVVYFNGGGKINPILSTLRSATGIGAYYLNPFDDILEARRILGEGSLIAGSINDIRLIDWTPDQIDREVARIMRDGKTAGGFIFGTLLMPFRIPEANIQALMDSARRHGGYDTGPPDR